MFLVKSILTVIVMTCSGQSTGHPTQRHSSLGGRWRGGMIYDDRENNDDGDGDDDHDRDP